MEDSGTVLSTTTIQGRNGDGRQLLYDLLLHPFNFYLQPVMLTLTPAVEYLGEREGPYRDGFYGASRRGMHIGKSTIAVLNSAQEGTSKKMRVPGSLAMAASITSSSGRA